MPKITNSLIPPESLGDLEPVWKLLSDKQKNLTSSTNTSTKKYISTTSNNTSGNNGNSVNNNNNNRNSKNILKNDSSNNNNKNNRLIKKNNESNSNSNNNNTNSNTEYTEDYRLGDFGTLWRFLEGEKQKWDINGTTSNTKTIIQPLATVQSSSTISNSSSFANNDNNSTTTILIPANNRKRRTRNGIRQPPLLPNSSSSDLSSGSDVEQPEFTATKKKNRKGRRNRNGKGRNKRIGVFVVNIDRDIQSDGEVIKVKAGLKTALKDSRAKKLTDVKRVTFKDEPAEVFMIMTEGKYHNNKFNKVDSGRSIVGSISDDDEAKSICRNRREIVTKKSTRTRRMTTTTTKKLPIPLPIPVAISQDPVHVFIDNSNILFGFYAYCQDKASKFSNDRNNGENAMKPRMSYESLFTILERERNIQRRVLVASSPLYQPLDDAEQTGYEVSILKRVHKAKGGTSGGNNGTEFFSSSPPSSSLSTTIATPGTATMTKHEQCVDELLHLKILESLLDYSAPSTLVLASGDGKDAEFSQGGFFKCVTRALNLGWKVEVVSWQRQISKNFLDTEFIEKWDGKYGVVFLDWFARELGSPY